MPLVFLALVIAATALAAPCPEGGTWPDELSGVAPLADGRLLLVDDEERRCCFLATPSAAGDFVQPPTPLPLPLRVDDLEGATADSAGHVYLLASHSPTRKGKVRAARRLLVRLEAGWTASAPAAEGEPPDDAVPQVSVIDDLLARLDAPEIGDRSCNLEGLAWYPGGDLLLVGARAPRRAGQALVFAIGPARALFAGEPVTCETVELDLGGRAIRGLEYDPWRRGCLVLAGPGGEASGPRDYAVYLWRPAGRDGAAASSPLIELEVTGLAALPQPEAICAGGPPGANGTGTVIVITEGGSPSPIRRLVARPRRATEER